MLALLDGWMDGFNVSTQEDYSSWDIASGKRWSPLWLSMLLRFVWHDEVVCEEDARRFEKHFGKVGWEVGTDRGVGMPRGGRV